MSNELQLKPKLQQNVPTIMAPLSKKTQKVDLVNESVKPCFKILQMLQQHKLGWPFL